MKNIKNDNRYNQLNREWDSAKNGTRKLSDYFEGSQKDVWWICDKGHSWKARISHRYRGSGCPFCSNRRVWPGFNDLAFKCPELASEWNYKKNGNLKPSDIVYSSANKVWWVCNKGHEWEASISQRGSKKTGCPVCSGRVAWKGVNDLASVRPDIAKEWDYEKNADLRPDQVTVHSKKKVWWHCLHNHSWKEEVDRRITRKRCPVCSGKIVLRGFNDLLTTDPHIASTWDYEKNKALSPDEVTNHSDKKVWWLCPYGHSWRTSIRNRCNGAGCLICSNQLIVSGINDLVSTNPLLASEWAYDKNPAIQPSQISANSTKKVWWRCTSCGNIWKAEIHSRNGGKGCPKCAVRKHSSFPEQTIYYYIKMTYDDAINSYKDVFDNGMELDIYIPSLHLGIEYDGEPWHTSKRAVEKERKKYSICKKQGILLIRIKEKKSDELTDGSDYVIYCGTEYSTNNYISIFNQLKDITGRDFCTDIDIRRDSAIIMSQYQQKISDKSLSNKFPQLCEEWDYERNNPLSPNNIYANANMFVWWKCKNGHSWNASVDNRVKGNGCPYCSGRRAIKGKTDLQSNYPELCEEWDYEINKVGPEEFTTKSNKKVGWICKKGHHFNAVIASRTNGSGCPYCVGKKVLVGFNDMKTLFPTLAEEWDFEKNGNLKPTEFTANSGKKVWWKCKKCGFCWEATISNRTNGTGCPKCARKRRLHTSDV